jgi:hypothetical protein
VSTEILSVDAAPPIDNQEVRNRSVKRPLSVALGALLFTSLAVMGVKEVNKPHRPYTVTLADGAKVQVEDITFTGPDKTVERITGDDRLSSLDGLAQDIQRQNEFGGIPLDQYWVEYNKDRQLNGKKIQAIAVFVANQKPLTTFNITGTNTRWPHHFKKELGFYYDFNIDSHEFSGSVGLLEHYAYPKSVAEIYRNDPNLKNSLQPS